LLFHYQFTVHIASAWNKKKCKLQCFLLLKTFQEFTIIFRIEDNSSLLLSLRFDLHLPFWFHFLLLFFLTRLQATDFAAQKNWYLFCLFLLEDLVHQLISWSFISTQLTSCFFSYDPSYE
jgi:hypothetical protein